MALLDAQVHLGVQASYATAVPPTRSYEAMADTFKYNLDYIESPGFRAGLKALHQNRKIGVLNGVTADLEFDVMNKGFGYFWRAATGSSVSAQIGATAAYTQTHTTTADGPLGQYVTMQIGRPAIGGAATAVYTFSGGKINTWELDQQVGQNLKLKLGMDFRDEDTTTTLASSAYQTSPHIFNWTDCAVTISGSSVRVKEFNLKCDNQLDTDRRFLQADVHKLEPYRKAMPVFTGQMTLDYTDTTQYDLFKNGTIVPVVATWTYASISATINYTLTVTLNAVQFQGDSPEVSYTDLPQITAPFQVLDDFSTQPVKVAYVSTDTAF